jgi:hypothetical protein
MDVMNYAPTWLHTAISTGGYVAQTDVSRQSKLLKISHIVMPNKLAAMDDEDLMVAPLDAPEWIPIGSLGRNTEILRP